MMDNFFSNVELFMDLLSMDFYAIWMVKPNRVGLSMDLKDTKAFKNFEKGFIK